MVNEKVFCACGCGKQRNKFDVRGRERKYLLGHTGWITGSEHSIETKKIMSIKHLGKNNAFYGKKHSQKALNKMKGRNFSLEHKKNISKSLIGTKRHLGCKHSIETKKKISELLSGKNSYLWKGGISFEPYGFEFNNRLKLKIRRRDNFTCKECNFTEEKLGYKLHVHHIDYNKRNNSKENLISLCNSCHSQTNFDRDDWTDYFEDKLMGGR